MSGYSQRTTPYPDAPGEDLRRQSLDSERAPAAPDREQLSWWRSWGERTFYLLVFVSFVALLTFGSTWW
jgi:hypothetical protein